MPLEWKHWQGQTINAKFVLGEFLGGSADSAIFLTSVGSQQSVIKLIALDLQGLDAKKVNHQLSLWAAARNFSHPHIIRIFEAGQCLIEDKPLLYVVTDYAEENLSMILPTRALTLTETQEMIDPVLEALSYIHGQGFVHGHLKPSNIMALNDTLKISCDGITPIGQRDEHPAKQSSYLPPEAASEGLSSSADIWSLGMTLVEVLTQQAPQIRSDAEKENAVSKLPSPFRNIASECLRTDPKQRCTIEDIQNQLHSPAPVGVTVTSPAPGPPRRRSLVGPIAIVVLLGAILAGAFLFGHRSSSSTQSDQATQTSTGPAPNPQPVAKVPPNSASSGPPTGSAAPRKAVRRVLPDVSNNALHTIHGTIKVKVRVRVDSGGSVENARLESRGPSRYFANKSMDAAKQWRFDPAGSDDKNVPGEWDLEFRFSGSSRQVREKPVLR